MKEPDLSSFVFLTFPACARLPSGYFRKEQRMVLTRVVSWYVQRSGSIIPITDAVYHFPRTPNITLTTGIGCMMISGYRDHQEWEVIGSGKWFHRRDKLDQTAGLSYTHLWTC